ncbi:hypothetical protein ACIBXA_21295 [Micromonospora echinaurantiaca]
MTLRAWILDDGLLFGGDGGAKVCVVPLIAMVAERSSRGCLMTLRIAS